MNIGEWSELYTFFKLLADGKLYAADANINRIPDVYFDILRIIRADKKVEFCRETNIRVVSASDGKEICSVPLYKIIEQTQKILSAFQTYKKGPTKGTDLLDSLMSESKQFAESMYCNSVKAGSGSKTDIYVMIHDIRSSRRETLGFSIKSQMGTPATLLNASTSTNIKYKVTGRRLTPEEIDELNKLDPIPKFRRLAELGCDIEFDVIPSETFNFNLQMVSSILPAVLAEMVKLYYKGATGVISELTDLVAEEDLIQTLDNKTLLRHLIKDLLTMSALGMKPASKWSGIEEATGGYIIVKDDGDIVCYHIYDRNNFRDYLFKNTKFDKPSVTRYHSTIIYVENGEPYMNINIQIRFTK